MKGNDQIKDLFSDKLGGFEAKVNPELWEKVASQIGAAGSTAAAAGMSIATKLFIGLGAASVITVASIVVLNTEEAPEKEVAQVETIEEPKTETPIIEKVEIVPEKVESNDTYVVPAAVLTVTTSTPPPTPVSTQVFISPEERITMEDNPLHNVYTPEPNQFADTTAAPLPADEVITEEFIEEKLITPESTKIKVVFPNVFTPNNDGINDLLFISETESLNEDGFLIRIIDANYKEVYTSTDPNFEWDGRDKGGYALKAGQYIALITANDKDGKEAIPVMYQFEIRK